MTKERKLIKQREKIRGDTLLSEVISAVSPGFTGIVDIEGNLIISEEDLKYFESPEIVLPFQMAINGDVISQKDGRVLIGLNLTVRGDLLTIGGDISIWFIPLTVDGNLLCNDGMIQNAGGITVNGDLICDKSIGSITGVENSITVKGDFSADNVIASDIDVKGDMACLDITADNICVQQDMRCGNAVINRDIIVKGDAACGEMDVKGCVDVRGDLDCLTISGASRYISVRGDLTCNTIESDCQLNVTEDIKCKGDIVAGPITVKGDLYCGGDIVLQGDLTVKGKLTCEGIIDAKAGLYSITAGSYECPDGTAGIKDPSFVKIG